MHCLWVDHRLGYVAGYDLHNGIEKVVENLLG